jgi:hypothetical protein
LGESIENVVARLAGKPRHHFSASGQGHPQIGIRLRELGCGFDTGSAGFDAYFDRLAAGEPALPPPEQAIAVGAQIRVAEVPKM